MGEIPLDLVIHLGEAVTLINAILMVVVALFVKAAIKLVDVEE